MGFNIRKSIIIIVIIVPLIIITDWNIGVFQLGLEFSTGIEAKCKDRLSGKGQPLPFLSSPDLEVLLLLFA